MTDERPYLDADIPQNFSLHMELLCDRCQEKIRGAKRDHSLNKSMAEQKQMDWARRAREDEIMYFGPPHLPAFLKTKLFKFGINTVSKLRETSRDDLNHCWSRNGGFGQTSFAAIDDFLSWYDGVEG